MSKTALIVLDLQNGIVDGHFKDTKAEYLSLVSTATKRAREAGIHIIHVKTCFRPGHPEISKNNYMLAPVASFGVFVEGNPMTDIAPEVAPVEGDIVMIKRRVSAFSGSDLDTVLRGLGVDSLVLAGVATSGAVLSTMRQAADLDFNLLVVSDLCRDQDDEVHRVLLEKVFPRQGRVLSTEEWFKELSKGGE